MGKSYNVLNVCDLKADTSSSIGLCLTIYWTVKQLCYSKYLLIFPPFSSYSLCCICLYQCSESNNWTGTGWNY